MTLQPSSITTFYFFFVCCCWLSCRHACALALQPSAAVAANALSPAKIAVIGSGAAGLTAARVLSRNGWKPTVLEQAPNSGGVWKYHAASKTRPVYQGLRTNLPKEIMAYREYPWPPLSDNPQEDPSFVTHAQVLDYLQSYQEKFNLSQYIHFGCTVTRLNVKNDTVSSVSPPTERWPQIELAWDDGSPMSDIFDAVLVCNGHYAKPSIPNLSGAQEYFTGRTLHSIEYDNPQDFAGQRVLCIGARASGEVRVCNSINIGLTGLLWVSSENHFVSHTFLQLMTAKDLAREISGHASHVVLSSSTCPPGQAPQTQGRVTLVPRTKQVQTDGSVLFDGYSDTSEFDAIIYCTGYDYDFPFIHNSGSESDSDNDNLVQFLPGERRVKPLFEQLFHARYPNLSFLGLPHSVLPFPLFEFQAEAVVAQFSAFKLPDLAKRLELAAQDATSGGPNDGGRVPQDTHFLGNFQWDYMRRLAQLAGTPDDEIDKYLETTVVRFVVVCRVGMLVAIAQTT